MSLPSTGRHLSSGLGRRLDVLPGTCEQLLAPVGNTCRYLVSGRSVQVKYLTCDPGLATGTYLRGAAGSEGSGRGSRAWMREGWIRSDRNLKNRRIFPLIIMKSSSSSWNHRHFFSSFFSSFLTVEFESKLHHRQRFSEPQAWGVWKVRGHAHPQNFADI